MADLNIRNVPDELIKKLKQDSVDNSATMRAIAIELLGRPYIDAEAFFGSGLRTTMPRAGAESVGD